MTIFQACILGMVQGLSEFLPISSSAHLILVPWFLKWPDPGLAFDVFLHLGTLVAVLGYFAKDWWVIINAGLASIIERRIGFEKERLLFWLLLLGTIPGGISGILFHKQADTVFRSVLLISVSLSAVGFLLYWIDGKYAAIKGIEELGVWDVVWIGIAQAFAIIPGVSRSGSTMAMGRLLGLNREASAKFSFLLSFPIISAAGIFEWHKLCTEGKGAEGMDMTALLAGFGCSTLFGVLTIHFLLRFLRSADFRVFAWYRILLACLIVFWTLAFK